MLTDRSQPATVNGKPVTAPTSFGGPHVHVREDFILTMGLAGARRRRSLLPTALLAALLALTLAACGGSDDGDSAEAEQPAATTSSAEQTTTKQTTTKPSALTATITGTITFGAEPGANRPC